MLLFAHHMAVEIFGREFAPRTPLEHFLAFFAVGTVLALACYGAWTLAAKVVAHTRTRSRVRSS